jgi:hypothetical protein
MNERKDEKWLDSQLQRAVEGTTPVFDAQAWKQKHRDEYQTLLGRGKQPVGWGLPHRFWASAIGKLAVAAAIAVAVGLFVLSRDGQGPNTLPEPHGPVAQASPARMMSMMSLRMAYQQGGFEALDRQLQDTLDEFGPRSSSVPIRELFLNM